VVFRKRGALVTSEFQIVRCDDCAHVYVNPRIADRDIPRLYDEAYYQGRGFDRSIDYSGAPGPFKIAEAETIVDTMQAACGDLAGKKYLDFGCGTGFLLSRAVERGADAVGFDESPQALEFCKSRGLPVISGDELASRAGTADIVTAVEVIEHVPDPRGFLRYLTTLPKPGGVLYVQTGNWDLVRRLPGTPYIMPEGHIHYFSPPIMRRLFAEVGLSEAKVFNRSWYAHRNLHPAVRRRTPIAPFEFAAKAAVRFAPRYAPFPVGRIVG